MATLSDAAQTLLAPSPFESVKPGAINSVGMNFALENRPGEENRFQHIPLSTYGGNDHYRKSVGTGDNRNG